jgi:hypothetical protein
MTTTRRGLQTYIPTDRFGLAVINLLEMINSDRVDGEVLRPIFEATAVDLDKAVVAYAWWVQADDTLDRAMELAPFDEEPAFGNPFFVAREDAFDAVRALATAIQPTEKAAT